jgi:hypothetical protein
MNSRDNAELYSEDLTTVVLPVAKTGEFFSGQQNYWRAPGRDYSHHPSGL